MINDYLDRKEDALHPEKKYRPLASGALDPNLALGLTSVILPLGLLGCYFLGQGFFFLVFGYLIYNICYSLYLKHIVILDVMSISIGFVLRAIAGAVLINVKFSSWLLLCTFMLSLFWGFAKRRGEIDLLAEHAGEHRKILDEYSPVFLDLMMGISASLTILSYVMYSQSSETIHNLGTDKIVYTIPIVVFAIFRSLYIVYIKNMGHNPTKAILGDRTVLVTGVVYALVVISLLYLPNISRFFS